ncbi:MAG: metallophosphoesterase [Vicinamibacterales bacterium]
MGSRAGRQTGIERRDFLKGCAAVGIGALAGAASHGFLYERLHVGVTRATLSAAGWAEGLSGLRIGFLTDLHRSETVSRELSARAVDLLMQERPDLIVLGGDYVTLGDPNYVEPAAEVLSGLSAPFGVFAVLGNHDDDHDMAAALNAVDITVLRDARTQLRVRGEPLDLVGIRYWTHRTEDIAKPLRGASRNVVLLAHSPSRLTEAAALAIPVVISGHTHGGQIVLPGLGPIAARRFPVVAGTGQRDNTAIFVSRGVGTVYLPVRLNCPPEVVILTMQPVPVA